MPVITINTAKKLSNQTKDYIKSSLGKLIEILPNKTEKALLIDISDERTMYFDGKLSENFTYVDIKIYGSAPFEFKSKFTKEVINLLVDAFKIDESEIYISIDEFSTWGSKGNFK